MASQFLIPRVVGLLLSAGAVLAGCAPSDPSGGMSGSSVQPRPAFNATPSPSEVRGAVP